MTKARDLASASIVPAAVSVTELGYIDGVTSAIQTQMNTKAATSAAINPTIVDAKGDLIAASAADTVSRLAVGANDTVLTADSTTATGLKWAAAGAAGSSWSLLSTTATTSGSEFSITGLAGYDKLMINYNVVSNTASNTAIRCRFNSDTAANYDSTGQYFYTNSATTGTVRNYDGLGFTSLLLGKPSAAADRLSGGILLSGCNATTGNKQFQTLNGVTATTDADSYSQIGVYKGTSAITSFQFISDGTFDAGSLRVYGSVA